ncbi:MAG: hypothetical protein WC657_00460 [Candidatus Paceibacterota bacterium]|jgi:hypothetical protein
MKKINQKIIVLILVITFVFSPLLANKAEAGIPVIDYTNITKEYGLDGVASMIVNTIIERMSKSVVNWINSGFQGSPAFITNPEAFYTDIGDKVAGQYIFSNPNLNFLCGPIQAKIRLALARNYNPDNQRWQCTLTQVGQNMDNFMDNFDNGGWDNFFELTQRQQNNPIGAYIQAENEMYLQISTRQGTQKEELLQGNGFMSYKECKPGTEIAGGGTEQCFASYQTCLNAGGPEARNSRVPLCNEAMNTCNKTLGSVQAGDCKESDKITNTPGSVIESKLNEQLGMGQGRLQAADEINEMVSALLNQLISQVVGGIGKGLRSLSQPDSSTSGQTFTDQLSNSTAASTTDYFGNQQNLDVLNVPIPNPDPICDPNNASYNPMDPLCATP